MNEFERSGWRADRAHVAELDRARAAQRAKIAGWLFNLALIAGAIAEGVLR